MTPTTHPSAHDGEDATGFEPTIAEEPQAGDAALPGSAEDRPLQALPTIGHIGRYALKYQLGMGGLGTVHAAIDPLLSRPIAIKTLHLGADRDQRAGLEALLLHEARAAAGLSHPHIVTVYDAGLAEEGVYIAMERLQGRDLRQLLAEGWRPSPRQAAQIVRRVAEALDYAHAQGVIHCDIKPANIFMVGRTQPKVLDFGIARVAHGPALPGGVAAPAGSPFYMAPEQLDGGAVDARSDVYALGVVLYELLTGQRPFDGADLAQIGAAVRQATPAPAHRLNPLVPVGLSELCAKAMSREPAQRHRSARALARALRGLLDDPADRAEFTRARATAWAGATVAVLASALLLLGPLVDRRQVGDGADGAAAPQAQAARLAATAEPLAPPPAAVATAGVPLADRPAPVAERGAMPAPAPALRSVAASPSRDARRTRRDEPPAPAAQAAPAPPPAKGLVRIAVSPWGQVEVDGAPAGTTPPLTQLQLPAGTHTIVIRNDDFPPHVARVTVSGEQPVLLRHRFGS